MQKVRKRAETGTASPVSKAADQSIMDQAPDVTKVMRESLEVTMKKAVYACSIYGARSDSYRWSRDCEAYKLEVFD